jgi:hypothetical protein
MDNSLPVPYHDRNRFFKDQCLDAMTLIASVKPVSTGFVSGSSIIISKNMHRTLV